MGKKGIINSTEQEKNWKAAWGRGDLISEDKQGGRVESITTGFARTLMWLHAHHCNCVKNFWQTSQNNTQSFARPMRHGGNRRSLHLHLHQNFQNRYFLKKTFTCISKNYIKCCTCTPACVSLPFPPFLLPSNLSRDFPPNLLVNLFSLTCLHWHVLHDHSSVLQRDILRY